LQGTLFLSVCFFSMYGNSQFLPSVMGSKKKDCLIVPSTQDLNQLLGSIL
jgi:hypothetical protein